MVGIQGLNGIPEPKSERTGKARNERENVASAKTSAPEGSTQDGVEISPEARAAAEASRLVQVSKSQPDIRADRVAAARERIERGDYKDPEVVAKVAAKLLKFFA